MKTSTRMPAILEHGFSLVELLIVIVILGVLAGVVVFAVGNLTTNAQNNGCDTSRPRMETAVESYRATYNNAIRGFALVEALVVVLALSIVISLGVMLFVPHHDPTRAERCHRDAEEFQTAVNTWHENDEKKLWPGENDKSIALDMRGVVLALETRGFLNEDSFEHLDGSMKRPVTLEQGWTYDFKMHQVDDDGCDSR